MMTLNLNKIRRGFDRAVPVWAVLAAMIAVMSPGGAFAQGVSLALSGVNTQRGQPVEVRADNLNVDSTTGETVFSGNAVLGQGDMRIAAPRIVIIYAAAGDGRIQRLDASGGVTFVTATEAAEAQSASYDVEGGEVRMTGSVILTQGENVLSGDRLTVNLQTGQGRMEGQVRSIIQTTP